MHTGNGAFDQSALDYVLLSQVVVFLKEDSVGHTLEQVFTKHRLRFRLGPHRSLPRLSCNLLEEVLLGEFHVVDKHDAELVLLRHFKQSHQGLRKHTLALAVAELR